MTVPNYAFFLLYSDNTSATQTKQKKDDLEEREKTTQKYVSTTFLFLLKIC